MRFQVNRGQVLTETIDGETIMIGLNSGNYYSLDDTGSHVWNAIERTAPLTDIVAFLMEWYEGPREEIEEAVVRLLDELHRENLIVPCDGTDQRPEPATNGDRATPRRRFQAPRFEKHTDMQDLILLDPVHEVADTGWPHAKA